MSTYGILRKAISAYMHRDASAFVDKGIDALELAINNAKNFAQRAVDFEKAKVFGEIANVDITNGALKSSMVLLGTATPVVPKSIERVFMPRTGVGGQVPVRFYSRDGYNSAVKRRLADLQRLEDSVTAFPGTMDLGVLEYGDKVYVIGGLTQIGAQAVTLQFDIVEWLPDFTTTPVTGTATSTSANKLVDTGATFVTDGVSLGDSVFNTPDGTSAYVSAVVSETTLQLTGDIFTTGEAYSVATADASLTNFLLVYCFDYMLFRSIYELNFFLKEDERVAISQTLLNGVWDNLVKWNGTIIGNSTDDNDLR